MIKLKSLFRRGQTPSQSSSKHSNSSSSSNNNRNKSQSTQSLNTAIENEDKKHQAAAGASSKFYPNQQTAPPPIVQIEGSSSERGVDVGDDHLNTSYHSLEPNKLSPGTGNSAQQHAHTLPHKKNKGTTPKKGQKQPKPLPVAPTHKGTAPAVIAPAPGQSAGDVMSSMAAVAPGNQSSSVKPGSASSLSTSHSNPALSATTANAAGTTANDLYTLNPAFMAAAAAASYQFINNEQQQILEVSFFFAIPLSPLSQTLAEI